MKAIIKIKPVRYSFNTGLVDFPSAVGETMFLSISRELEYGPGIIRNGVTAPSMLDPKERLKGNPRPRRITNPKKQRYGSWGIQQHLQEFADKMKDWLIVGAQGCADLTMNYWHVAYRRDELTGNQPNYAYLNIPGDLAEPLLKRTYTCLIKWKESKWKGQSQQNVSNQVTVEEVKFVIPPRRICIKQRDGSFKDETEHIALAVSGKPIVRNSKVLDLGPYIDRWSDVRHIFTLPKVGDIYFGEQFLIDINRRRQALYSPVLVPRAIQRGPVLKFQLIKKALEKEFYTDVRKENRPPARPGEFGLCPEDDDFVDIFFRRSVYQFSAIGTKKRENNEPTSLVCLAIGGLQVRLGSTVEGVARSMADYGNCSDAMIFDEGFDVFQIVNPAKTNDKGDVVFDSRGRVVYKYSQNQILNAVSDLLEKKVIRYPDIFPMLPPRRPTRDPPIKRPKRAIFIFATKNFSPNSGVK